MLFVNGHPYGYSDPHNVISIEMNANFFFDRAVRSLDRFQYDKALKYFRKAVEYEPDNPVNHCNMAGILSETEIIKLPTMCWLTFWSRLTR